MNEAEKAGEASMDEILASIRRIIADEPAGARAGADRRAVNPLIESPSGRPGNPLQSAMGSGPDERLLPPADRFSGALKPSPGDRVEPQQSARGFDDDLADLLDDRPAGTGLPVASTTNAAGGDSAPAQHTKEGDPWATWRALRPGAPQPDRQSVVTQTFVPTITRAATAEVAAPASLPVEEQSVSATVGVPSTEAPAPTPAADEGTVATKPQATPDPFDFTRIFPETPATVPPSRPAYPQAPTDFPYPEATALRGEPHVSASPVQDPRDTPGMEKVLVSPSTTAPATREAEPASVASPATVAAVESPASDRRLGPAATTAPAAHPVSAAADIEGGTTAAAETALGALAAGLAAVSGEPMHSASAVSAHTAAAGAGAEEASRSPTSAPATANGAAEPAPAATTAAPIVSAPAEGRPVGTPDRPGTSPGPARGATPVRTMEEVVAEMLRPMLEQWIERNMPRIMEKALRVEMAKSTGKDAKTSHG